MTTIYIKCSLQLLKHVKHKRNKEEYLADSQNYYTFAFANQK